MDTAELKNKAEELRRNVKSGVNINDVLEEYYDNNIPLAQAQFLLVFGLGIKHIEANVYLSKIEGYKDDVESLGKIQDDFLDSVTRLDN
jgi:hypothetical protein